MLVAAVVGAGPGFGFGSAGVPVSFGAPVAAGLAVAPSSASTSPAAVGDVVGLSLGDVVARDRPESDGVVVRGGIVVESRVGAAGANTRVVVGDTTSEGSNEPIAARVVEVVGWLVVVVVVVVAAASGRLAVCGRVAPSGLVVDEARRAVEAEVVGLVVVVVALAVLAVAVVGGLVVVVGLAVVVGRVVVVVGRVVVVVGRAVVVVGRAVVVVGRAVVVGRLVVVVGRVVVVVGRVVVGWAVVVGATVVVVVVGAVVVVVEAGAGGKGKTSWAGAGPIAPAAGVSDTNEATRAMPMRHALNQRAVRFGSIALPGNAKASLKSLN